MSIGDQLRAWRFPKSWLGLKPLYAKKEHIGNAIYADARAFQSALDQICGWDGWRVGFERWDLKSARCSLALWSEERGEWIQKDNVGEDSVNIAPQKGGVSDAFKRACLAYGLGRYLYAVNVNSLDDLPPWALCDEDKAKGGGGGAPAAQAPPDVKAPNPEDTAAGDENAFMGDPSPEDQARAAYVTGCIDRASKARSAANLTAIHKDALDAFGIGTPELGRVAAAIVAQAKSLGVTVKWAR